MSNPKHQARLDKLIKEIARGGIVSLGGQICFKGLAFITHILLARFLGVASYGLYALGFTILIFIQRFSSLGLQNGVVRFGAIYLAEEDKARLKGTLLSSLLIPLSLGLVFCIIIFYFSDFIATEIFNKPALAFVLKLFAISLPFYSLMMVGVNSFRVFRKMEYEVLTLNIFHPFLNIFILAAIFLLGYRLIGAVLAFIISSLLSAILVIYLIYRIFPEIVSNIKAKYELKKLLPYSLTMLLLGFSYILLLSIDRVMIGFFGSEVDVGIYNAAAMTASQASIFLGSFAPIFLPSIAELSNKNQFHNLEILLKAVTKWIFIFTLPLSMIFILFPKEIMGIFGPDFIDGWAVLVLLSVAQLLNASTGPIGSILTMSGRQKVELINSIFLGVSNAVLNIFLIQRYGVLGAAIATGLSLILVNIARLLEVYFFYRMHPYRYSYSKPIIAALGAIALYSLIDFVIAPKGGFRFSELAILGIIYFLILILLGTDEEDNIVLQAVKKKIARA
ncbi:MAG: flippase [Candidatus Aenigmarchaeota archaeon]|nr:flippase [Candidatus Aenigmarchaeota archaeon]